MHKLIGVGRKVKIKRWGQCICQVEGVIVIDGLPSKISMCLICYRFQWEYCRVMREKEGSNFIKFPVAFGNM